MIKFPQKRIQEMFLMVRSKKLSSFFNTHGILLMFLIYCTLEIFRAVFEFPTLYYSIVFLGGFAFIFFGSREKNSIAVSEFELTPIHKSAYILYFILLIILSSIIVIFRFSIVISFLPIQLFVMWYSLGDEKTINVQRMSIIFSVIYVSYFIFTSENVMLKTISSIFIISVLVLQYLLDRYSMIRESNK